MSEDKQSREANWAQPVETMDVHDIPTSAMNLNVQGRRPMSLLQGFGQMWQKTYRIRLEGVGVTPTAVISDWKAHFPDFWPKGNSFYGPLQGVKPGEVAVLNLSAPGGMKLSTGVRVIYADDESFSFMTPQGHMFAGMITFSAFADNGVTVIQIQALIRASDPYVRGHLPPRLRSQSRKHVLVRHAQQPGRPLWFAQPPADVNGRLHRQKSAVGRSGQHLA